MSEFAAEFVAVLGRMTLLLAVAAMVVRTVLWATRSSSPAVHRVAWCLVLVQGWLLLGPSVGIPYYETERYERGHAGSQPELGKADSDSNRAQFPSGIPASVPQADPRTQGTGPHWHVVVLIGWLGGMAVCVVAGLIRYVGFVRRLPPGQAAERSWVCQWEELLESGGIGRAIPMRVTSRVGPLLCRLPAGCQLFVPAGLWRSLTVPQRWTILRHELAHYQRRDQWKSLAVRLLALPHWFNPFAWWAVRKFDESAEWACDQAATGGNRDRSTDYAKTLLRLGEGTARQPSYTPAVRGHGLAIRIRRLVRSAPGEGSVTGKTVVISVALALVALCSVRFELVAREPAGAGLPADAAAGENPLVDGRERASGRIRELGGRLQLQQGVAAERAVDVVLADTTVSDDDLVHLKRLGRIRSVNLRNTQITDAGLVHLTGLASLESLDLTGTKVTDAGMAHLTGLTRLQSLGVGDTLVTEAGLAVLAEATSNRHLPSGFGGGGFGGGMGGVGGAGIGLDSTDPADPASRPFPHDSADGAWNLRIVSDAGRAKLDSTAIAVVFEDVPLSPGTVFGPLKVLGPGPSSGFYGSGWGNEAVSLESSYRDGVAVVTIEHADRRHVLQVSERGTRLLIDGKHAFDLGGKKRHVIVDAQSVREVESKQPEDDGMGDHGGLLRGQGVF